MNKKIILHNNNIMDNHNMLRNIPATKTTDSYENIVHKVESTRLLRCITSHLGVQRTIIDTTPKRTSFKCRSYTKGEVIPRNEIVLKPDNWVLAEETITP